MKFNLIGGLLTLCAIAGAVNAAELTVKIDNIQKAQGKITVRLFNSESDFLKSAIATTTIDALTPSVTVTFPSVVAGEYAVSTYHDIDGNGELNRNFMGIPKEPNGVSKNARGNFGPPNFNDAKFILSEVNMTLSIELHD